MPIELIYLIVLLAVICLVFIVLKRPIYEAMFVGYIAMIACLGAWGDFGTFLLKISTNTLFYAIIAFLTVAHIFSTPVLLTTVSTLSCQSLVVSQAVQVT